MASARVAVAPLRQPAGLTFDATCGRAAIRHPDALRDHRYALAVLRLLCVAQVRSAESPQQVPARLRC